MEVITMKKFKAINVEIEESVDWDSEAWKSFIEEHPGYEGLGYLGVVQLEIEASDNEWEDSGIYNLPILVYSTHLDSIADVGFTQGMPTAINLSGDAYPLLKKRGALSGAIWHEIGHILNGDGDAKNTQRVYAREHNADKRGAEFCGVDAMMETIRTLSIIVKKCGLDDHVNFDSYVELAFRASDLGNEKAAELIRRKGWVKKEDV